MLSACASAWSVPALWTPLSTRTPSGSRSTKTSFWRNCPCVWSPPPMLRAPSCAAWRATKPSSCFRSMPGYCGGSRVSTRAPSPDSTGGRWRICVLSGTRKPARRTELRGCPPKPGSLLIAQGDEWIDAGSPARRNIDRDPRDRRQRDHYRAEWGRVVGLHAEQETREQPREAERGGQPRRQSDSRQQQTAPDHHAQHVAATGAQRHADADLLCPLLHRIRHQSVNSEGRQQQSRARENRQQQHVEIRAGGGFRDHLFHCADFRNRQLPVYRQELVLDRGR